MYVSYNFPTDIGTIKAQDGLVLFTSQSDLARLENELLTHQDDRGLTAVISVEDAKAGSTEPAKSYFVTYADPTHLDTTWFRLNTRPRMAMAVYTQKQAEVKAKAAEIAALYASLIDHTSETRKPVTTTKARPSKPLPRIETRPASAPKVIAKAAPLPLSEVEQEKRLRDGLRGNHQLYLQQPGGRVIAGQFYHDYQIGFYPGKSSIPQRVQPFGTDSARMLAEMSKIAPLNEWIISGTPLDPALSR